VRPYLERPITHKTASRVAWGVSPEFKPQYSKKKKKKAIISTLWPKKHKKALFGIYS
jgi:hypothetical protein